MSNHSGRKMIEATTTGTKRRVRYLTDEQLGQGTGARVIRARRLPDEDPEDRSAGSAELAQRVALKVSTASMWQGKLADEAGHLLRLLRGWQERSRNGDSEPYRIVRIGLDGEVMTADDGFGPCTLIELEYLDGVTLAWWLKEEWLPRREVGPERRFEEFCRVATQLGEALRQLGLGEGGLVIHRDIKPENIMRTSQGLRLFDFNVSREERGEAYTHAGTLGYMAPEVFDGRGHDHRADLWSAGAILWQVLHQRPFDLSADTASVDGRVYLRWPSPLAESLPDEMRQAAGEILNGLLCEPDRRFSSADDLLAAARRAWEPWLARRRREDQLQALDMIGLLCELRPSGLASVVTDTSGRVPQAELQAFLRERMQVDDPLESWLAEQVASAATARDRRRTLFVLAGNAGDGKSHLIYRLIRHRLQERPEVLSALHYIADATHALSPEGTQAERLSAFFAPFADRDASDDERVHLIAMNTGMVIRFFERNERFTTLYQTLQRQLGLRRPGRGDAAAPWRVEVVNLDLRDLLSPGPDGASFAERMLERLDPDDPAGIAHQKWATCQQCPALSLCPVAFNLRALQLPAPRGALLDLLRRASLDADVHLSPRNLWGFLYRLVTGGAERYEQAERPEGAGPCDVVRERAARRDGDWLMAGHLSELLFSQAGAGAPWTALTRQDPAYSAAPALDALHTRLSIRTELDNEPEVVDRQLGGQEGVLAGLALRTLISGLSAEGVRKRRDAAVRRQVLFHAPTFQAWFEQEGGGDFPALLRAYERYSWDERLLDNDDREQLKRLTGRVQDVFRHGNGREIDGVAYLKVSQPNVRSDNELLVRADDATLGRHFKIQKIMDKDLHILAHRGREHLLRLLGYRPELVGLNVAGIRLAVDLSLYEFLIQVELGQKPSVRDLSEFQALRYIGERVGNLLARPEGSGAGAHGEELFVYEADERRLHRLVVDDFGQVKLTVVASGAGGAA